MTGVAAKPLISSHDVLLLDLDGVVYVGPHAVPGAVEALSAARAAGARLAFVTNNASRTPAEVATHLVELGIPATPQEVVTSAQAGARLLSERLPPGSSVLAVGGPGVAAALEAVGLVPVRADDLESDDLGASGWPVGILQGFGREVGWRDLAAACEVLTSGAIWIAANLDATIPLPTGVAPGNGLFVKVVAEAVGRQPDDVAGKPYPALMEESITRTGARAPLVVGDRLDTDIEAATRLGMPSLLVLTGVTTPSQALAAAPEQRPTVIGTDLAALLCPVRVARRSESADARWTCGDAVVEVSGGQLTWAGPDPHSAESLEDALAAAAQAAWTTGASTTDVGRRLDAAHASLRAAPGR